MDLCLESTVKIFDLNTLLFKNVFRNIDEKTARLSLSDNTNSMIFIALHMLDARYYILDFLGIAFESEFKEVLSNIKVESDSKSFPPLGTVLEDWDKTAAKVRASFSTLTAAQIKKKSPVNFPIMDDTILGAVSFLIHHESYHLGQLGILRKYFGFGPMSYDDPSANNEKQ